MIRLVNYGQLADVETDAGSGAKNILILQGDSGRQVTVETSEKSLQNLVTFIVKENRQPDQRPMAAQSEVPGEALSSADDQPGEESSETVEDVLEVAQFVGSPFPPSEGDPQ